MFDNFSRMWTIPVVDSGPGDCKWPADGTFSHAVTTHYCGLPVKEGKVYCPAHCELAYTPLKSVFVPRLKLGATK